MIISKYQLNSTGTFGFLSNFCTLTSASAQVGYPLANVQTNDLSLKAVTWGQRASHNWFEAQSDVVNSARTIKLVGLLGLERVESSYIDTGNKTTNTYRVIIDQYPIATRRRIPVSSVSLTNLSGSYTLLNGSIDPPNLPPSGYASTKMTAANPATDTFLIASFENYNATERALHPTLPIKIRLHYVHSVATTAPPSLDVVVTYNGSIVAGVTSSFWERTSEGFIGNYQILPGVLPGLTGRLGIQVQGFSTGTSTPVPIGVECLAELSGWHYDSGYTAFSNKNQLMVAPGAISPTTPITIPASAIRYIYVEVSDFCRFTSTSYSPGPVTARTYAPLGGFQGLAFFAGRLVIAGGLEVALKISGGLDRSKVSDIGVMRNFGGYLVGNRNPLAFNEYRLSAIPQPQSTVLSELDELFDIAGMRNPIVIIPDSAQPNSALYAVISSWDNPDNQPFVNAAGAAEQHLDFNFTAVDAQARRTPR